MLSRKLILQDLVQLFQIVVKRLYKNFVCISNIEVRINVISVIRVLMSILLNHRRLCAFRTLSKIG